MSRDPPDGNKKRKVDSGVMEESEDGDDLSLSNLALSSESINNDQFPQSIVEIVRASSRVADECNFPGSDPTSNASAGLPSLSDLAEDPEFGESFNLLFLEKQEHSDDPTEMVSPADLQVATSAEPPKSRGELEQLFLDIFSQHIQGATTDNSLLEELKSLLPSVARTHVNALIGHMLDWIERNKSKKIHNVQVLAPMVPDSNLKVQSDDPTMHSHGVRVVRGPYKCHFCGNLKKNCRCELADDDGSGEVEGIKKRKFTYRRIEDVEGKIKRSIERGLKKLKSMPLEDCTGSEESKKGRSYICNLCGFPKLPKEEHQRRCILRPRERFKMGKDGKTVFKVEEILSEKGTSERAREEGSSDGSEKDGGSTENRCNRSDEEEDDKKPAAKRRKPERAKNEDGDRTDDDKDGGDRDNSSDKDSAGDFDEIKKYAV